MKKKSKKKAKQEDEVEVKPRIEDTYPHEFWLEKFQNQNNCHYMIFDKFLANGKLNFLNK